MKPNKTKLTERGRRALAGAGAALAIAGAGYALHLPDTHTSGTVEIANPDVNLEGQGTSGRKAFDAAVNEVNRAVNEGRDDGIRLNVSQEEVEQAATMLLPEVRALDQNPNPNQVDIEGHKLVTKFANGELQTIGFQPVAKQ